jgi:ADP-glucose pyrophosphorylase
MARRRARVLGMIMAGGKGERLHPLTRERSKPSVPFGARYRIIDFVLSNFVNSEMPSLYVLVQYKSQSLIEHLRLSWRTDTKARLLRHRRAAADALRPCLVSRHRRCRAPEPQRGG